MLTAGKRSCSDTNEAGGMGAARVWMNASTACSKEIPMKQLVFGTTGIVLFLLAWIVQAAEEQLPLETPQLTAEFAKVRDQVLPNPTEQSYRTIRWRNSVLHGIVDAQKNDRPIMLILMNGHPLGCT
jgi:hypothetical protein